MFGSISEMLAPAFGPGNPGSILFVVTGIGFVGWILAEFVGLFNGTFKGILRILTAIVVVGLVANEGWAVLETLASKVGY